MLKIHLLGLKKGNKKLKSSPLDNPTNNLFEFDLEECSLKFNNGK